MGRRYCGSLWTKHTAAQSYGGRCNGGQYSSSAMRLFRALAGFRHGNHERRCPSDMGCEVKTDKE